MWFNYGLLLINYRSTTTIEVCYRPNTFIFAMENFYIRLDLYKNFNFSHMLNEKGRHYVLNSHENLLWANLVHRYSN